MLKLLKFSGGTVCGNPAGPEGLMPKGVPVTKPRSESCAKLLCGLSVTVDTLKKLARIWFTATLPIGLVLLITNCCARDGVIVSKPGTLELCPNASTTLDSSM